MEPLSRVESGAKPPGESERALSPRPPLAPVKLSERPLCLAAQVAEDCLNFRKSGSNPPQIRRYGPFAGCTAAAEAGGKCRTVSWMWMETAKSQFVVQRKNTLSRNPPDKLVRGISA